VEAQFTCTTNHGTITITGYTGNGGAVAIPNMIDGYPVTGIGDYALECCTNLTSVSFGYSITNVGLAPFLYCSGLTNITVAANNPNYSSLNGVLFDQGKTTLVQYPDGLHGNYLIPASVVSIGTGAFSSAMLTSVIIPGNITNIDYRAFAECSRLTNAVLAEGVVSTGAEVFADTLLTEITIPASLTAIGLNEFAGCLSLIAITVDTNNPAYQSVNGVLFNKSQTTLVEYPAGATSNFTIPTSVTTIGDVAFLYSPLTNLTIPGTVRTIGINSFGYSDNLTNVTIANGVLDIGDLAFYECRNLASVSIPFGVTNIGEFAFSDCENLLGVIIPGSVATIGRSAFDICLSLASVVISDGVQDIGSQAFGDCYSLANIVIPESVTNIGSWAFTYNTSLLGVYFRGSPPSNDSSAWFGDDNVTAYYLPATTGWAEWSANAGIPVAPWLPQITTSNSSFGDHHHPFGFNITWASGQTVVVETCTNLAKPDWLPLQTLSLTNDTATFSDPQWTNYSARYYGLGLP